MHFGADDGDEALEIPSWFLDHCVVTCAELKSRSLSLIVQESPTHTEQSTPVDDETSSHDNDIFEVESVVYDAMHAVVSRTAPSNSPAQTSAKTTCVFEKNSMLLTMPKQKNSLAAPKFLQNIVEYFAADIGADLITIQIDDVIDLAQYLSQFKEAKDADMESYLQPYFEKRDVDYGFRPRQTLVRCWSSNSLRSANSI